MKLEVLREEQRRYPTAEVPYVAPWVGPYGGGSRGGRHSHFPNYSTSNECQTPFGGHFSKHTLCTTGWCKCACHADDEGWMQGMM